MFYVLIHKAFQKFHFQVINVKWILKKKLISEQLLIISYSTNRWRTSGGADGPSTPIWSIRTPPPSIRRGRWVRLPRRLRWRGSPGSRSFRGLRRGSRTDLLNILAWNSQNCCKKFSFIKTEGWLMFLKILVLVVKNNVSLLMSIVVNMVFKT